MRAHPALRLFAVSAGVLAALAALLAVEHDQHYREQSYRHDESVERRIVVVTGLRDVWRLIGIGNYEAILCVAADQRVVLLYLVLSDRVDYRSLSVLLSLGKSGPQIGPCVALGDLYDVDLLAVGIEPYGDLVGSETFLVVLVCPELGDSDIYSPDLRLFVFVGEYELGNSGALDWLTVYSDLSNLELISLIP